MFCQEFNISVLHLIQNAYKRNGFELNARHPCVLPVILSVLPVIRSVLHLIQNRVVYKLKSSCCFRMLIKLMKTNWMQDSLDNCVLHLIQNHEFYKLKSSLCFRMHIKQTKTNWMQDSSAHSVLHLIDLAVFYKRFEALLQNYHFRLCFVMTN